MTKSTALFRLARVRIRGFIGAAMSQYRTQNITQEKLLALAANLLHKAFFDTSRALAKRRYQALEQKADVFLVDVAMEDGTTLRVNLRLDSSELRAKLNFSAFRDLIGQLLAGFAQKLEAKQALPAFATEDNQRWSFLIPALHREGEHTDVLILGLDLAKPGILVLELMFVDPAQFAPPASAAT